MVLEILKQPAFLVEIPVICDAKANKYTDNSNEDISVKKNYRVFPAKSCYGIVYQQIATGKSAFVVIDNNDTRVAR